MNKIMPTLLLTAFDPFAHYTLNPSWEAVKALPETINNYHIHKLRLPNIFNLAPRLLLEEAERVQPDVILLTGMNSGSTDVEINLAALNIKDALIEDNMGRRPWNEPILADAPAAYFATIPVHEIVRSLRAQSLPVQLEFASGGYVCNEIFYRAAHAYAGTTTKVGFVHVPLLPEMVFDESLARPLDETGAIVKAIIECL